jgi:beta-glucosidase
MTLRVAAFLLLVGAEAVAQPYRDASLPIEARVRDLLGRMTIEDKFWQLYMIPGGREDPTHDYSRGVFGLQNRSARDARGDAALQNALQRFFVDSTRLGIPIIPFEEAVHGLM